MQVEIVTNAKDGCIREGRLVDVEEGVADRQVRKDHEVDLTDQFGLLCRIDGLVKVVKRCEKLESHVAIVAFGRQLPAMACGRKRDLVVHGRRFDDGVLLHGGMRAAVRRLWHSEGFEVVKPEDRPRRLIKAVQDEEKTEGGRAAVRVLGSRSSRKDHGRQYGGVNRGIQDLHDGISYEDDHQ